MKKRKALLNIAAGLAAIFLLWFAISVVDVTLHNNVVNPKYLSWNLFQIFFSLQ